MLSGAGWLLHSAFLHASWNALVKRERDPQAAVLGVLAAAVVFSGAVALVFPGAGLPNRAALLWGLGAGLCETF
jgi:hypothetical protein